MHNLDNNVIRLLQLLMTGTKRTNELATLLEVDKRSVGRMLTKLENLGYNIDRNGRKGNTLLWEQQYSLKKFNNEESHFVAELIQIFNPQSPLAPGILRKLGFELSSIPLAKHVQEVVNSKNFENLKWAIQKQCLVHLKPYHSNNEQSKDRNRTVLPLQLNMNHRNVYAYEINTGTSKTFKLSRIGMVEITNDKYDGKLPPSEIPDPFGFYALKVEYIHLSMTKAAAQLMEEEFPQAALYLTRDTDLGVQYKGPMCNPVGIGRFILGLPGMVKVISNEKLAEYIQQQRLKY